MHTRGCARPADQLASRIMRMTIERCLPRSAFMLAFVLMLAGCAGGSEFACRRDPITGSEQCAPVSNAPAEAAVAGGAAAVAWGVVGCTVNGCPAPDRCNERTKQCEPTTCRADKDCVVGFHCDTDSSHCR